MAHAQSGQFSETPQWPRPLLVSATVCLLIGLAWRLARYLLQFPIWGDEAFILIDVYDRDYAGLTQTLTYWQVAPLLFLWGERLVITLFGASELAVHLLPFLASTLGLVVFACTARRWLAPLHGALAIAVLAVSYYPVRHGCEAKPYSFDLLVSATLLLGGVGFLADAGRVRWLVFLTLTVPFALCASYPAAFVAGGVSLALLPRMRNAAWSARGWYAAFNLVMLLAFIGHFLTVGRNQVGVAQAAVTNSNLHAYWRDSFPPDSLARWPRWLLQTHTGGLLAYPVGGPAGTGAVPFLLCVVGGWHLWSRGRRSLVLLCVLPFALTLFAAGLGKYPYGGSARIAQHLAPMACLLIAAGAAALIERVRGADRWAAALCLLLAALGIAGIVRDVHKPYKTEYDQLAREFVTRFWDRVEPGEEVVICNDSSEVIVNYHWYLCRDRANVHWLGAEKLPPAARGVWLVHLYIDTPSAAELHARLRDAGHAWSVAGYEHSALPKESPGDATFYWTTVHLVRAR